MFKENIEEFWQLYPLVDHPTVIHLDAIPGLPTVFAVLAWLSQYHLEIA